MAERLLEGVRVLDLSMHLSGPYGAMLLGDMGAEVIKIEPPTGDPQRLLSPTKGSVPVIWASINRNKKSVVIDLRKPAGRRLLLSLVATSDVVFNNYRPGVLDRLELDFETLRQVNPRIVVGNLTGYGMTGPRRQSPAYDVAIQALTGAMSLTGHPGAPPARAGIPIADLAGGMFLALAVVSALRQRDRTGEGVQLDLSLFDTSLSLLMYWAGVAMNSDSIPPPQGNGNSNVYPYGAFPASDGWVVVAPYSGKFWPSLCHALDRPELVDDSRFIDNNLRLANRDALEPILNEAFGRRPTAEWLKILEDHDVPVAPVNNVSEAMSDPQVDARQMRIGIPIDGEPFEFVGNPIKTIPSSDDPTAAPPRLGQHTREVLRDLAGADDDDLRTLAEDGVIRLEDIAGPSWVGSLRTADQA